MGRGSLADHLLPVGLEVAMPYPMQEGRHDLGYHKGSYLSQLSNHVRQGTFFHRVEQVRQVLLHTRGRYALGAKAEQQL